MPSLRQLRYFEALARFGHFGKAADACAITQPALSMQIQDLEEALGVTLVERRSKGVFLTETGQEVARRARRILAEVRDLSDFAGQRREPLSGRLDLGIIPTVAPYVLPRIFPSMRERYPSLDLYVRETQTRTLVEELLDGSLDLLILALPVDHPEIETSEVAEDRFLLAVPPDRSLDGSAVATPDMLKQDRLLLLEEGHCLRDQSLAFCRSRRVDTIDTFGAASLSTLVQMVASGAGQTLLPEISVELEARRAEIRLLPFEEPQPKRRLGLAFRTTSPRKRDFAAFGALVAEAIAKTKEPRRDRAGGAKG